MPDRRVAATFAVLAALGASPAQAEELATDRVVVDDPVSASCTAGLRTGGGVAHSNVRAPADGYLTARLSADGGDWDLAVYRDGAPVPVAASAYRGAVEVAAGYVQGGDLLIVQACRRSGRTTGAALAVDLQAGSLSAPAEPVSLVRVSTTEDGKDRLLGLGLDVTENGGRGFLDVYLHGSADVATLRGAGFDYDVLNEDARRPSPAAAASNALPSGRTHYRRLFEVSEELADLANRHPDIVKPITLPLFSGEGRRIEGLEITTNPRELDGKPVFLMLGMHHAREWPTVEASMEWARELVDGFRAGDPRTVDLLGRARMIVVPVVNADGYNDSRESGHASGNDDGTGNPFTGTQMRRKNCRQPDHSFLCDDNEHKGVDPNRNYAGFWGGVGSSTVFEAGVFRGSAPFSEPDSENVRRLIASRQVVALITNHTASRKILRQPGVESQPPTIDEPEYRALGDAFAAENGYTNQFSVDLYPHGGTTDAWSYYATGGFAYVFEHIHPLDGYHPPYGLFVAEYDGSESGAGGNREAYFKASEWAADPAGHSLLTGNGSPGAVLRLTKSFFTSTQEGFPVFDRLDSVMQIPASGAFEWHVNPSTRPTVAAAGKRESWTLTCEIPAGTVRKQQAVFVRRGETVRVTPCPFDVGPIEDVPVVPPPDEFAPPPP